MIDLDLLAVVQSHASPERNSSGSPPSARAMIRAIPDASYLRNRSTISGRALADLRAHDDGHSHAFLRQHARDVEGIVAAADRRDVRT